MTQSTDEARLTKSQKKTLQEEFLNQGVKVKISFPEHTNRARFFVTCKTGFTYHVYVGKRGKIYENESGDY